MSMDDVLLALQAFNDDLETFTSTMATAASDLEREHSSVVTVWNDTYSEKYRQQWQSFQGHLDQYLQKDAHRYRDFLEDRTMLLRRYLHG